MLQLRKRVVRGVCSPTRKGLLTFGPAVLVQMTRTNLDSIPIKTESTHLTLLAEDGTPIDVIDFDFFDDSELILAIKLSSAGGEI